MEVGRGATGGHALSMLLLPGPLTAQAGDGPGGSPREGEKGLVKHPGGRTPGLVSPGIEPLACREGPRSEQRQVCVTSRV